MPQPDCPWLLVQGDADEAIDGERVLALASELARFWVNLGDLSEGRDWLERFVDGLGQDLAAFAIGLLGGDTTATPGPVSNARTSPGSPPGGTTVTLPMPPTFCSSRQSAPANSSASAMGMSAPTSLLMEYIHLLALYPSATIFISSKAD